MAKVLEHLQTCIKYVFKEKSKVYCSLKAMDTRIWAYWNIYVKQYKWSYPGNVTITKHILAEAPKEGEMMNK